MNQTPNLKFKPLGNKILVEPNPVADKIGRIFLPENAKEKSLEGTVITLGTGKRTSTSMKIAAKRHQCQKRGFDYLNHDLKQMLCNILLGEKIPHNVANTKTGEIIIPQNRKVTQKMIHRLAAVRDFEAEPSKTGNKINEIICEFKKKFDDLQVRYDKETEATKNGEHQPFEVKPGDKILYGKFAGTELEISGRKFNLIHADDVLAILE
jgi:chaperonin GroES